ncbi:MAG: peptidoglycan DD-metalloendopeptidase family protein [Woeseiaceae bacterium]|nr:peptidoglycan DD-metalloendopeptidase family protein [Woeseiaceae bacterium]
MTEGVPALSAALFDAILHSIWQGCALALVFAVMSRRMGSAQSRYLLGMTLFLLAPIAFIATFVHALSQVATVVLPSAEPASPSLANVFAIAWCVGVAFVGGRYFLGWTWLRLVIVRQSTAVPESVQRLFAETRQLVGVSCRIGLRASASIASPMATGIIRPIVVLPISMLTGTPSNVLTAVFVHELLHIRRLDHIAVFIQALGETLLFYHPAVHWLSAESRRAREYRCDDDSVRHLGDRYDYARALLSIEESAGDAPAPALMMNGGDFMNRVERILGGDIKHRHARPHFSGMLAFVCIALLMYSLSFGNDSRSDSLEGVDQHDLSIAWLPPSVTQWQSMIEAAAERHDVSADVLALMLLVESHGEALATSSGGARGLMQVMPKTGQAIAVERGIAGFDMAQLFDPQTNIDFGAWYLAQMMERFSDHPERAQELAISAYNAGPGQVSAYVSGDRPLPRETVGYRNMLLSMLSEAGKDRSLVLEGRKAELRDRLPEMMAPVEGRVTSRFGDKGNHGGVDIAAPMGAPVVAPVAGRVRSVGVDDKRGKFVTVAHLYGVESHYYHLSEVSVKAGDAIGTGEVLGSVGNSGASTGPHLHFEMREFGQSVSPALYGLVLE